jgi:release factor glutamine methyltransferase
MNIQELLAEYSKKRKVDDLDLETLLMYLLQKDRSFLITHSDYQLSSVQINRWKELFKRRSRGEPVAYILGYKNFYGLRFYVDKNVLIPRPETEQLVDLALDKIRILQKKNNKISILDVGTGSGCVGISIIANIAKKHKKEVEHKFTFTDISKQALAIAKGNYETLINNSRFKVKFIISDLFENLANQKYDMIVSNPPYIPQQELPDLMRDVRDYEPHIALDGGEKGLDIIIKLIEGAIPRLSDVGTISLEVHKDQPKYIVEFVGQKYPDLCVRCLRDVFGRWRFISISRDE